MEFDVSFTVSVLDHLPEPQNALNELLRISRLGVLLLSLGSRAKGRSSGTAAPTEKWWTRRLSPIPGTTNGWPRIPLTTSPFYPSRILIENQPGIQIPSVSPHAPWQKCCVLSFSVLVLVLVTKKKGHCVFARPSSHRSRSSPLFNYQNIGPLLWQTDQNQDHALA